MTTLVQYAPSATAPFQFQPVLDGATYLATVLWNTAAQRNYLKISAANGSLVCYVAMVGSPPMYDINLVAGYFATATLVWRPSTGNFEIGP